MKARDNPFRSEAVERIAFRLEGATWLELLEQLRRLNYRASLVGPHGSGKTTLLEELGRRLAEQGFRIRHARLSEEHPRLSAAQSARLFKGLSREHLILLDGAEQLSWLEWRRFLRRCRGAGGLIITTHKPGRLPVLYECRTSARLLEEILSGICPQSVAPRFPSAETLFERSRGNICEALRACYDLCALQ